MKLKLYILYRALICFAILSCSRVETASNSLTIFENDILVVNSTLECIHGYHENWFEVYQNNFPMEDHPVNFCEPTAFKDVITGYFNDFAEDPYFDINLSNYYTDLHREYVYHYRGDNYFGQDGEFDQLVKKRKRELNRFWDLNRDITINGQHTETLNNREALAAMIESFDRTIRNREEAYALADELLLRNQLSPTIPESPLFAMDAFSTNSGLLVLGDGLIESLVTAGTEAEIVVTGIIAHEWFHQAHFKYSDSWRFPEVENPNSMTLFKELEADFAAAYYMSHKRGATFNWKKIEKFFELSYNVGDCLPHSTTHHGTPHQRKASAFAGYQLANAAQKKGSILDPNEIHEYFLEIYNSML